ncbi:MAG TPA: aminoacyl-tRNA hydrolase [Rhizobiaceae bacterium]|nr:aminoacyl-tRNA hydrolase [Rhizobiaceae bacterium]
MLVVAGLGNPGASYAGNRHNIGFMAADAIARRHSFSPWRNKFKSLIGEGEIAGEKVLVLKPQTFMNVSGEAVGEALRFHKLQPSDLIVFYDELDLPPGKLRVKTGGGAGGHNGIRSIDSHCGNAYRRVRLGIGHPGHKDLVQRHVLGDFAKADAQWLDPLMDAVAEHFPLLVKGDDATFMNKVALATGGKEEKPQKAGKEQSHIRQARPAKPKAKIPETGPMAAMLKKLFGGDS